MSRVGVGGGVFGQTGLPLDGGTITGALTLQSTLAVTGAVTMSSTLDVTGALTLASTLTGTINAIATAATVGETWTNTTAATGAVTAQYSPASKKTGHAWKSNATAASQQWDWIEQVRPVTGAAASTSAYHWLSQIDGGGYTSRMNIDSNGMLSVPASGTAIYCASGLIRSDYGSAAAFFAPYGGCQIKGFYGIETTETEILYLGKTTAVGVQVGKSGGTVGLYAATPVVRAAHIVDADGTLADVTAKFNTLLVAIENIGILLTA